MTVAVLSVPFVDVRAADLRWALDLPDLEAVASRDVALDRRTTASLRVLGASHQVVLTRDGTRMLSETVACGLPAASALPGSTGRPGYRFGSTVDRHEPEALSAAVAALAETLTDDPSALLARFPGAVDAVTALRLLPEGWETWHAYPNTGELVHTQTSLTPTEEA